VIEIAWHQVLELQFFNIDRIFSAFHYWHIQLNEWVTFRRDRESDRESRIRERREEQDKKKEEQKLIKKAAREHQRIEQGKKGWWKDFNWCIGVMVEMEWNDEWWDAIVIQVLPAQAQDASIAEGDCVLQGESAALISHAREAGLDVNRPAVPGGVEVDDNKASRQESVDTQDGALQKADEVYTVKKCQVIFDWHDLGMISQPDCFCDIMSVVTCF
jgi:hypothetical protein